MRNYPSCTTKNPKTPPKLQTTHQNHKKNPPKPHKHHQTPPPTQHLFQTFNEKLPRGHFTAQRRALPGLQRGSLRPKRNLDVAGRSHPFTFLQFYEKAATVADAKVVLAPFPSPRWSRFSSTRSLAAGRSPHPSTTHPSIPDSSVLMMYRNMSKVWNRLFLP